MKEVKH